jgi:arylsulfatase A-like enzyme
MNLSEVLRDYLEPAVAAGLLAGGVLGLVETLGLAWGTGQRRNLAAAPYAVVAYGLLGLVGSLGMTVVGAPLAVLFSLQVNPTVTYAVCGAVLFAGLAVVVGRYRLNRDLFHEHIRMFSRQGLLFHVGLLAGGIGLALLMGFVAYSVVQWMPPIARWWGGLIAFLIVVGVACALSLIGRPLDGVRVTAGIPPALRDRPNVILIGLDALRADRLGCYGHAGDQSPCLDALAADGVRYDQAITQSSWTKPSFATILTSLYPSTHQAVHKSDRLPGTVTTLAEILSAAGYRTGGFANNINIASHFGFDQGFGDYVFLAPDYCFWASDSSSQLAIYQIARRVRAKMKGDRIRFQDFYQDAEIVNREAISWLEANRESRFFLFLHYMDPHDPYFEHPYNGQGYARASNQNPDAALAPTFSELYDGEVRYLDEHLGQFFDWLKAEGLYDDALIVLTSDHGEEFQEHGGWWHGQTLYEEQIWVPLIVKYPGGARAGMVVTDLARSLDIAPTILDVLGLKAPEGMMGRSLWSETEPPHFVFSEEDHEGNVVRSVRTHTDKLILANPDNPRGLPGTALYDLSCDPGEQNDLSAQYPGTASRMKKWVSQAEALTQGQAVEAEVVEIDPEVEERLRNLGYIE